MMQPCVLCQRRGKSASLQSGPTVAGFKVRLAWRACGLKPDGGDLKPRATKLCGPGRPKSDSPVGALMVKLVFLTKQ
jgi:hypothetical protein